MKYWIAFACLLLFSCGVAQEPLKDAISAPSKPPRLEKSEWEVLMLMVFRGHDFWQIQGFYENNRAFGAEEYLEYFIQLRKTGLTKDSTRIDLQSVFGDTASYYVKNHLFSSFSFDSLQEYHETRDVLDFVRRLKKADKIGIYARRYNSSCWGGMSSPYTIQLTKKCMKECSKELLQYALDLFQRTVIDNEPLSNWEQRPNSIAGDCAIALGQEFMRMDVDQRFLGLMGCEDCSP